MRDKRPGGEGLRERGKRQRRERILDATAELVRERPEQNPSVEEIADRADVSQATVFNLIGTRAHVWAALANRSIERPVQSSDETASSCRTAIERLVRATVAAILDDPAVHRAIVTQWPESGRLLRNEPVLELRRLLQLARSSDELTGSMNPDDLAALIATTCTGAVHQWAAGLLDGRELERRCMAIIDLVFAV